MNTAIHIYLKEIREMFRDKRVRSGAFVQPFMMMFLLLFIFGFITNTLKKPENLKVHVIGSGPFVDKLRDAKMTVVSIESVAKAEEMIRKGDIRLALEVPPALPAEGQQTIIRAYFDSKDEKAKVNVAQLNAVFDEANRQALEAIIVSKGLPKEASHPVLFEEKPIKVGQGEGASEFIISLLPYLIVVYAFYGGMGSAGDMVAGEKEKMTLETLLITPVSRLQVAMGKFLAMATICFASSFSATLGLLIAGSLKLKMFSVLFPNGTGITPTALLITFITLLPAVALFAGLMLAVSTKAKNIREAQTQMALLSLLVLMPAMFSQFIGFTDFAKAGWISAVPVLNTASSIRAAMNGKYELGGVAIGFAVNALIAIVAITWAIKLFKKEEVLVRV